MTFVQFQTNPNTPLARDEVDDHNNIKEGYTLSKSVEHSYFANKEPCIHETIGGISPCCAPLRWIL